MPEHAFFIARPFCRDAPNRPVLEMPIYVLPDADVEDIKTTFQNAMKAIAHPAEVTGVNLILKTSLEDLGIIIDTFVVKRD